MIYADTFYLSGRPGKALNYSSGYGNVCIAYDVEGLPVSRIGYREHRAGEASPNPTYSVVRWEQAPVSLDTKLKLPQQ